MVRERPNEGITKPAYRSRTPFIVSVLDNVFVVFRMLLTAQKPSTYNSQCRNAISHVRV